MVGRSTGRADQVRRTKVGAEATPADWPPQARAAVEALSAELEALRVEVARLGARLEEAEGLADRDALTPVLNRRAFMRELDQAIAFARRYGSAASLIYFDVDGFKAVNDRFGHAAGDAALRTVAERLLAHVRTFDAVGRLGGDEFGVVLVRADGAAATAKAQTLAAEIEGQPVQIGSASLVLKISYGVRELDPSATAEQMLADADVAMFARKRARACLVANGAAEAG